MALNSSTYFTNSIVGQPQAGADVNIYDTHASPRYPVGFGFTRGDGNKYRYSYVGTATSAGRVMAPIFASSGLSTDDNHVVAPASAIVVPFEPTIQAGTAGSHFIEYTISAIAANKYRGGYFITEDGSGKGYTYRIKGNSATGDPASGNIRIQLYEPLKESLTVNTDVTIVPSMFNDLKTATVSTDWAAIGVLCSTTTASLPYAWVCTHGVIGALQDGTITGGDQVALSRGTAGAVAAFGNGTTDVASLFGEQILGYAIQAGATAEIVTIYLQLE